MGLMSTIGRMFTVITLILVLVGVKIYFDVMDDKKDFDELIQYSPDMTEEEYNSKLQICEEKDYFDPFCDTITLSYNLKNNYEYEDIDCESIQFNGVPYYLIPFEGKVESYFDDIEENCKGGVGKANQIIEIGMEELELS
jgi:hypothetical protein